MFRESTQRKAGYLIAFSLAVVTIAVTPTLNFDPINVPKLWVLLILSFGILGLILSDLRSFLNRDKWPVLITGFSFLIFMLISLLFSNSPLNQQIFGTYGRNTGFLAYVAFVLLFMGSAAITSIDIKRPIIIGISIAFGINLIYGLFQAFGKDPFEWSNPYTPVIGTLGNPNFAAAFLAIGMAFALPFAFAKEVSTKSKLLVILCIPIVLIDILKSNAQQGIVVLAISFGLIGYFILKSKVNKSAIRISYLVFGLSIGLLGILGTLQKGPLASLLYKPSVTYRGDYWHAGIKMFLTHPWFGVGLDSYGDYYRASRSLEATLRRGPSIVSNAAHNVFIDVLATAGIFTFLAYVSIIVLGLRAAYKISKRTVEFDPFFVGIFCAWIGYLVQSAISINNIALGIWGWVLPGILISMERWNLNTKNERNIKTIDFSGMTMGIGLVIGAVIGYLPFQADSTFLSALESRNANQIYEAAHKWPTDTYRYLYAAQLFDQNKIPDKAVSLARDAIKINTRSYEAWAYIYKSNLITANEKREILDKIKILDPNNPNLKKLGK